MGMYDSIKFDNIQFQTKDLDNILIDYELTDEGLFQLTDMKNGWNKVDIDRKKINYTGKISFYTHNDKDEWIEYWALLDHGKVLWIKRVC